MLVEIYAHRLALIPYPPLTPRPPLLPSGARGSHSARFSPRPLYGREGTPPARAEG